MVRGQPDRPGGRSLCRNRTPLVHTVRQLTQLSASQAAVLLSRREISAEELTRACLHRIDDRESRVPAVPFIKRTNSPDPPLHPVFVQILLSSAIPASNPAFLS